MIDGSWIADDVDYEADLEHGHSYELNDDDVAPVIRHPIGFKTIKDRKPIVRVKAWTRPLV